MHVCAISLGRELKSQGDFVPPRQGDRARSFSAVALIKFADDIKIVHHCSLSMRCLNWWVLWGLSGSPQKLCDTGATLRVLGVRLPVIAKDCHHTCRSNTADRDGSSGSNAAEVLSRLAIRADR